jgi:hypothetical protein
VNPPENRACAAAILRGMISFTIVSLAGFSVWAFAGVWFYKNVGEAGLYAACAIVFVGLAGLLMHPLLRGSNRLPRFYAAFVPAFLVYAVVWSVCWFALKFGAGEWLGSFLGCAAFAFVLGKMLKSTRGFWKVMIALFLAHSSGYFLGGIAYGSMRTSPEFLRGFSRSQLGLLAKMLWGLFYGLGFGAGIGYAFHQFQTRDLAPPPSASVNASE